MKNMKYWANVKIGWDEDKKLATASIRDNTKDEVEYHWIAGDCTEEVLNELSELLDHISKGEQ